MTQPCDVVVLGGGPAGLAAAISLSRLGRRVRVLERTCYDRPRAGETFGGELGPLLEQIGAREELASLPHVPFRGVLSAWGGSALVERNAIVHPHGAGWHVDRTSFDQLLARAAERAGVTVERGAGTASLTSVEGGWEVRTESGAEVSARFLVDASGRGGPGAAAQIPGRRWLRADRQIAVLARMTAPPRAVEPMLVLEAVEEGWWYSAPQPDGTLLVVLVTDADLLPPRGQTSLADHLTARLLTTTHTAARAQGSTLAETPWIARSDTGLLQPDRGLRWRAVGDAAMGCDCLAGNGVVRSLRAALLAAPEIDRQIEDPERVAAGQAAAWGELRDYLDVRAGYYEMERRWPDAPFWARRRPVSWKDAPLFLEPLRVLRWDGAPPSREAMAPVEALITASAANALVERLQRPQPAHQALGFVRTLAPFPDRRLLVALQFLVTGGVVTATG